MHPRSPIVLLSTGLLAAAGSSGCGRVDQSEKPDGARPPKTLQVSAAITDREVEISPDRVGGGPVRLLLSNQSARTVRATLAPRAGGGARRTRGPIPPGGVAAIQATLKPGSWTLRVGSGIASGRLAVGAIRPSADDELLLP